jgi:hypothetical protein
LIDFVVQKEQKAPASFAVKNDKKIFQCYCCDNELPGDMIRKESRKMGIMDFAMGGLIDMSFVFILSNEEEIKLL